jgi:DNA-binding CsgD family transcriptional regulator
VSEELRSTTGTPTRAILTAATRRLMAGELQAGIDELEHFASRRDLTEDLLVEAESVRLLGAIALDNLSRARQMAEGILASRTRPGEAGLAVAMTALAFAAWDGGDVADAVVMLRGAALRGDRSPSETAAVFPQLRLAAALTALGELDEAAYAIDEAQARIDRRGATLWSAGPAVRRAALHLAVGHLDDASAEARTAVALCAERSTGFFVSAAEAVLGEVALQRGDIRTAADHLGRHQVATTGDRRAGGPGQSGWAAARLAQAAGDDARLGTAVEALFEQGQRHRRLFVDEPGAGAWLTRVLLDIDHNGRHRAEVVVLGVEQLAGANPGVRSLEAAADHARGVLDGDLTLLERAAERHRHPWAAAAALEDAGEVLHHHGDHDDVRSRLELALAAYREAGADGDARRLQGRLSRLGRCHRRARPLSGWQSLTETERRVAAVVAEGLTNAEAAECLFVSRHTVDFHLRHIFDKLAIRSRVELVPVVLQHAGRLAPSR